MDFLFNSPVVPWAMGLLALYFAWTMFAPRLDLRVSGLSTLLPRCLDATPEARPRADEVASVLSAKR